MLGACEILGLDPLYVANEGIFLAFVERETADQALVLLRAHKLCVEAVIAGEVVAERPATVLLKSRIGGTRVVDFLTGGSGPGTVETVVGASSLGAFFHP